MIEVEFTIVFNLDNPNFEIKNEPEEIIGMLKNIPIVVHKEFESEFQYETITIGFVKKAYAVDESNWLYGDVVFKDEKYKDYVFSNYEVQVDDNIEYITKILTIEFCEKKG